MASAGITTRPPTTRTVATATAMGQAAGNRGKFNIAFEIELSSKPWNGVDFFVHVEKNISHKNSVTKHYHRSDFRRQKASDHVTGSGFPAQRSPNQSLRASASMNNLRQDTNDGFGSRATTTTEQDFRCIKLWIIKCYIRSYYFLFHYSLCLVVLISHLNWADDSTTDMLHCHRN